MTHKMLSRAAIAAAGTAALLLSAPSYAQLEEITVTARKAEEKIQDIPASITAIGGEKLEREAVKDIRDVARLTPGLVFDLGFVPQDTRPQIRGLPATRGRPPVGLLIDNIDVSSESMQTSGGGMIGNVQLLDLERIEVLKGPQSVLYGRAAFAGAINYVTAKPDLEENFVRVSADVGDFSHIEGRLVANGALSDSFALRGSLAYARQAGFYSNSVTGKTVGGYFSKGGTLAALWTPSDAFKLNARVAVSDDHYDVRAQVAYGFATGQSQNYAVPSQYVGICLGLLPAGFTTAPQATCPTGSSRVGTAGIAARSGPLSGYRTITLSVDPLTGDEFPGTNLRSTVGSINFDWDFGPATLTSWTGFARANSRSRQDVDSYGAAPTTVTQPTAGTAEPLNYLQVVDLDTETTQYSQELRLSGGDGTALRWGIGAQYWHEKIDQINYGYTISTVVGRSAARSVQMAGATPGANEAKTTKHTGVYASAEYDFTDRFTGRIEGRYNKEDYDYRWLSPARGIAFAPTTANPTASATNPQWIPATYAVNGAGFNAFTPRATLNFKATPDVMFYAVAAKGFKAGGFITLAGTPADFAPFQPETLWSYELGTKTTWLDGRATLNANLFFMKNKDKLFTTLEPDTRSVTGTSLKASNASDAESKGIELEGAIAIGEHWNFSAQYTYTKAEYTRYAPITTGTLSIAQIGNCTIGEVAAAPNPTTGAARVVRYCITSIAGIPLERAPKYSVAGTLTYTTAIAEGTKLIAEASAQYVGSRPEGANITGIEFDSFTNVDARVGLDGGDWSAFLYLKNAFDDKTIRSGQAGGDFASAGNQLVGAYLPDPRQLGVRVSYKF